MSGIVAIAQPRGTRVVRKALGRLKHRGSTGPVLFDLESGTLGQIWSNGGYAQSGMLTRRGVVLDGLTYKWRELRPGAASVHCALECLYADKGPSFIAEMDGSFAVLMAVPNGLYAARDPLGIAPLYQGMYKGAPCFASEVKALLGWAEGIREFPPGHCYDPSEGMVCYHRIEKREPTPMSEDDAATLLRHSLTNSVGKRTTENPFAGAWLSGGLDSSTMAVLARQQIPDLQTFAVGLPGAPDLEYARFLAAAIDTEHHELQMTLKDMLRVLPRVIYHLESFDALLVRSSIMNYMAAKLASDCVPAVFSGEGGDELFAGYEYLTHLGTDELADELVDITNRLHNTALLRVDRCSAAHGLKVLPGFLDREVVDLALRIPAEYKIYRNGSIVEKWVLRKAMYGLIPDAILNRKKSKFWEGSGVGDILGQHADGTISDAEFARERALPDGSVLASKEELMYYRIFRECFGDLEDLSFVGRTKSSAPVMAQG